MTTGNGKKGSVLAISVSQKKGIQKSNVPYAMLVEGFGIENDAHAGKWHRQVSLLSAESIDKMRAKGLPGLRPGAFAENITTRSLDLLSLEPGTRIKVGKEAVIEITQIGKECNEKCAIYFKAGDCVMPTEGIFARVIRSGWVEKDDELEIL